MLKDGQHAIHEVFYDDAGKITRYTAEPVFPRADDLDELADELKRYQRALAEPVLDFAALEAESQRTRIAH
jgi:hypothetical protein